MIINKPSVQIEVVLAGAVTSAELQLFAAYFDMPSVNFATGETRTETNGTTPVVLIPGMLPTYRREVQYLSVYNSDTAPATVTIQFNDGTTETTIQKFAGLPSGYAIYYEKSVGWTVYAADGTIVTSSTTVIPDGVYGDITISGGGTVMTVVSASETTAGKAELATQAETNTGTDDERIVTPLKLSTWWTAIKAAAATITGTWSFTSEKIRILNGAKALTLKADATTDQTWTFPDEGSQTVASRAYADALVTGLWDDRGTYDASGGAYPSTGGSGTAGAILKGDIWTISVAGTLPTSQVVEIGDTVRALVDTPGNTQANWAIAQQNIGYVAENAANKSTDGTFAANSDTLYPSQKAAKTYSDAKVADAINNGTTTIAPSQNAVYDAIATREAEWRTITLGSAFLTPGTVTASDVYWHNTLGQTSMRQGVGSSNPPAFFYLKASDYVSSIGLTPKLRIKVSLMAVNDVAPGRTITLGLYPCNAPTSGTTGAVGVRVYNSGTVVTGSNSISFVSPAADTMTFDQYSSVFNFPADGLYSLASLVSGAMAANSGVHIIAELQYHFE